MQRITPPEQDAGAAVFSPDGSKITYARGHELWTADGDGRNAKLLYKSPDPTPAARLLHSVSYSPDGRTIAFMKQSSFAVYALDIGRGTVRQLTHAPQLVSAAVWTK